MLVCDCICGYCRGLSKVCIAIYTVVVGVNGFFRGIIQEDLTHQEENGT